MKQTPSLPPQLPPEPLDAAERALAHAMRSLPGGSPPAELDARILGAARRSVHLAQPPKRDRRWLLGLGTAASCLLAIGLMWRTREPAGHDFYAPSARISSAARAAPASAPQAAAPPAPTTLPPAQPEPKVAADGVVPAAAVSPAMVVAPAKPGNPGNPGNPDQAMQQAVSDKQLAGRQMPAPFPAESATPSRPPPPAQNAPPPPSPPRVILDQAAPMSMPAPSPAPQAMESIAPAPPPLPPPPAAARAERKTETTEAAQSESSAEAAVVAPAPATAGAPADAKKRDMDQLRDANAAPAAGSASDSSSADGDRAAKNPDNVTATGSRVRRVETETASPVVVLDRKDIEAGATRSSASPSGSFNPVDEDKAKNPDTPAATASAIPHPDRGTDAALPPVGDDARLPSSEWIERIHARVKADDSDGARESLRQFRAHYPDVPIPDDLQALQQ